jgi:hypothetical protein
MGTFSYGIPKFAHGQTKSRREQAAPRQIRPATIDSLMPNYLPLLIPHLTPMMISYIKTEM